MPKHDPTVYNKVMVKNQLFSKIDDAQDDTQAIAIDDFDIQIVEATGDGNDHKNAKVGLVFAQTNAAGRKKVVSSLRMTMDDLKTLDALIHSTSENFFN
jgi:hypothetical protein